MRRFGLDKVLQQVWDRRIVVLVLPLHSRTERIESNSCYTREIRGADTIKGVLVKKKVEERHLTNSREAGDGPLV